jgi:hypothetical protein
MHLRAGDETDNARSFSYAHAAERLFIILFGFPRNVCADGLLSPRLTEEDNMKKFTYVIAALGAIAIAAPSIASAATIVVREGGHRHMGTRDMGARAEFRGHRDHGWRHHDRVVIVKHRHHGY